MRNPGENDFLGQLIKKKKRRHFRLNAHTEWFGKKEGGMLYIKKKNMSWVINCPFLFDGSKQENLKRMLDSSIFSTLSTITYSILH